MNANPTTNVRLLIFVGIKMLLTLKVRQPNVCKNIYNRMVPFLDGIKILRMLQSVITHITDNTAAVVWPIIQQKTQPNALQLVKSCLMIKKLFIRTNATHLIQIKTVKSCLTLTL